MKIVVFYLAALAALAVARPKFQPPYTLEGSPTAWGNPSKKAQWSHSPSDTGSYQPERPPYTKTNEGGYPPKDLSSYGKKNKYQHPTTAPTYGGGGGRGGEASPTGGYQQPATTPSYSGGGGGGGEGGGSKGGGYQQPTTTLYGGGDGGDGGGGEGSPTGGYQQPTSVYGGGGGGGGNPTAGGPGGVSAIDTGLLPSSTGTVNGGNATLGSGKVTLPAGCESKNGLGIGWLPDADTGVSLTAITSALGGAKPCWAGYYAQITSSTWDGSQLLGKVAEVKAGDLPYPIFVASVQPYIEFSAVPAIAPQIGTVMEQLTSQGLTVWLRFAHEMNWYDSAAAGYTYKGTSQDFRTAWGAVSDAVKSNPGVLMYWSPNAASAAQLQSGGWVPDQGAIDVIGVDVYPSGGASFANTYGDFCGGFEDIPFMIGETGSGGDKTGWLTQLTSDDAKTTCPNYVGFMWFEYDKDGTDFRVATNGNTEAASVLGTGTGTS